MCRARRRWVPSLGMGAGFMVLRRVSNAPYRPSAAELEAVYRSRRNVIHLVGAADEPFDAEGRRAQHPAPMVPRGAEWAILRLPAGPWRLTP